MAEKKAIKDAQTAELVKTEEGAALIAHEEAKKAKQKADKKERDRNTGQAAKQNRQALGVDKL